MPRLWRFWPFCETDVARGYPGDTPRAPVRKFISDLEALPAFLASGGDAVLVSKSPPTDWTRELAHLGFWPEAPPLRFMTPGEAQSNVGFQVTPWGWTPPQVHRVVDDAGVRERRALFAKDTWLPVMRAATGANALCSDADVPVVVTDAADLAAAIAAAATLGQGGSEGAAMTGTEDLGPSGVVVLKAPWGTSGRGAKRIRRGEWTASVAGWVRKTLQTQGRLMVAPWRARVADLSVQFDVRDGAAADLVLTRFETDARGQYIGHYLGPMAPVEGVDLSLVQAILFDVARAVGRRLWGGGHRGPAGIDAMLYRERGGMIRLIPLLDVNPRYTMGTVATALQAVLAPGVVGGWRLWGVRELRAAGAGDFGALAATLRAERPIVRAPDGRLLSGCVFTNPPSRAQGTLGVLVAGDNPFTPQ